MSRILVPGDLGTCPVCCVTVTMTHGGLRRHKGVTAFDLATDGICSGSHGPAVEEGPDVAPPICDDPIEDPEQGDGTMPHDPKYVTLFRRFQPKNKRWQTCTNASTDLPVWDPDGTYAPTIAAFRVEGCTIGEATAVVLEWLYKGRPASMNVVEMNHRGGVIR